MAEFVQNLEPGNLVLIETVLSFAISPFSAPSYNLPLFLFGVYAQESAESNQSLKLFTGLLGGSGLLDIIWLIRNEQNWFIRLLSIVILLFKGPTFFSFLTALRQRGEQFAVPGIRGGDLSGPTVWSMPGGFSSFAGGHNGYENVDGERDVEAQPRSVPPVQVSVPAGPVVPPPSKPSNQTSPGGYQTM